MAVYDFTGEEIGEIDDLVIRRDGRIKHATLEVGAWMFGIGGKVVPYSFRDLEIEADLIALETTQEELEQRGEFDYLERGLPRGYYFGHFPRDRMPGPETRGYGPYGYYGGDRYPYGRERWREPVWREQDPYEQLQRERRFPGPYSFSPPLYLATVVHDRDLIDPMGGRYGRVRDLVVSEEGRVESIILEATILGEDVYVALPYDTLGFTFRGVVYDISLDELEELPRHSY